MGADCTEKLEIALLTEILAAVIVFPVHPLSIGVRVRIAVIGVEPVLIAVKDGMFPVPLAASPMAVLELDQLKVAPAGVLVNNTGGTVAPVHTVVLAGRLTSGNGLRVML